MSDTKVTKDLENKTLVIERVINAPRERVWDAFTNAESFVKWWGPEGWETTVNTFEFKPGGRAHYCMKCVDKAQGEWFGQESWGLMEYETIDAENSFSYRDYFSDASGEINKEMPGMSITNEFVEEDGKTRFISTSHTETAEQLEQLVNMGMIEGFDSQLKKLDALVAQA